MSTTTIRAVVFDRDGVLTRLDEARLARELPSFLPIPRAEILTALDDIVLRAASSSTEP